MNHPAAYQAIHDFVDALLVPEEPEVEAEEKKSEILTQADLKGILNLWTTANHCHCHKCQETKDRIRQALASAGATRMEDE